MEQQAAAASLEQIKKDSLEHYEKLADAAHCWNNFIPKAIMAYNPTPEPDPFLLWLDQEIEKPTTILI